MQAAAPRWPRRLRLGALAGLAVLLLLHLAVAGWALARSWPGATGPLRDDLADMANWVLAYAALALVAGWQGLARGRPWAIALGFVLLLPWSFFLYLASLPPLFPDAEIEEQMRLPLAVGALGWALAILGIIGVARDPILPR